MNNEAAPSLADAADQQHWPDGSLDEDGGDDWDAPLSRPESVSSDVDTLSPTAADGPPRQILSVIASLVELESWVARMNRLDETPAEWPDPEVVALTAHIMVPALSLSTTRGTSGAETSGVTGDMRALYVRCVRWQGGGADTYEHYLSLLDLESVVRAYLLLTGRSNSDVELRAFISSKCRASSNYPPPAFRRMEGSGSPILNVMHRLKCIVTKKKQRVVRWSFFTMDRLISLANEFTARRASSIAGLQQATRPRPIAPPFISSPGPHAFRPLPVASSWNPLPLGDNMSPMDAFSPIMAPLGSEVTAMDDNAAQVAMLNHYLNNQLHDLSQRRGVALSPLDPLFSPWSPHASNLGGPVRSPTSMQGPRPVSPRSPIGRRPMWPDTRRPSGSPAVQAVLSPRQLDEIMRQLQGPAHNHVDDVPSSLIAPPPFDH